MMSSLLAAVLTAVQIGPPSAPAPALRLRCIAPDEIQLTIANNGAADTAILFGIALANGGRYLPHLTLMVSQPGGRAPQTLQYHPVDFPAAIGGRVDPWILPLAARSTVAFNLRTIDFVSASGRFKASPSDQLQIQILSGPIREATTNPDMSGLSLWRVWTGQLQSNALQVGHCPLEVLRERLP